jgi:hypothetical protein
MADSYPITNSSSYVKELSDAYQQAYGSWSTAWPEMKKDVQFALGDQWESVWKTYLESQGRAAMVFNKIQRVLMIVTGYQRKNRLSLKADPVEGSDELTANQFTGCLLWILGANGMYETLSDGFELGPLVSGINLMQIGMDYTKDIINGDPQLYRFPYNSFILDPSMSQRDMSDCGYAIIRRNVTKDQAKSLLPFLEPSDIDSILVKSSNDNMFPLLASLKDNLGKSKLRLYYYWKRTTKDASVILDKMTGQMHETDMNKQELDAALKMQYPVYGDRYTAIRKVKPVVELGIILNDEAVYRGTDPSGIEDDYPLVPLIGTWIPEHDDWKYKIQSMVRALRDPSTEKNKRISQAIDIIESAINSGWIAKEGSVVNPDMMYKSGQGKVVWRNQDSQPEDVQQMRGIEVPASHFTLHQLLDQEIPEIAGINNEMFGAPDNDKLEVAGVLAKMRMAAGIVGLQKYFDNYRFAKVRMGNKIIECIQKNWTPDKVKRVINQMPSPAFYTKKFGRYDCTVTEGLLTDSQRQMFYAELKALKASGEPIPLSVMVDYCPIVMKDELKNALKQAEQGQMQMNQRKLALDELTLQVMQAQKALSVATAQERLTQSEENRATAALDRAKAMAEIKDLGVQRYLELLQMIIDLQQAQNQAGKAAA